MRWQLDVLNDWGAVGEDMQFVHRRNGASIPRQVGKTDVAVGWAGYLAAELGMGVLYTAHNYDTTCEVLRRFREIFGRRANDPAARHRRYNRMVLHCENSTAQEAIFFKSGGFICFSTRTQSSKLGFSFDVIFYDEAQELTVEHMQAIAATTTSGKHGNPQEFYLGTPCRPGRPGNVFGPMRDEAHSEPGDDLCWWEWGVSEIGDISDEARWRLVNPSLDAGIANISSIRLNCRKFAKLGEEGVLAFAQEFLGYWLPRTASAVHPIDGDDWAACRTSRPPTGSPTAYAVRFSADGRVGVLAACVAPDPGIPYVEVVAYRSMRRGVGWFRDFLVQREGDVEAVVIDGKSNAEALDDELRAKGFDADMIVRPSTADAVAAYSSFVDATKPGASPDAAAAPADVGMLPDDGEPGGAFGPRGVSHFGQEALDASATLSGKRPIGRGGGFGFESNDGADATLVEACALAYWCAVSIRRYPRSELRIG